MSVKLINANADLQAVRPSEVVRLIRRKKFYGVFAVDNFHVILSTECGY